MAKRKKRQAMVDNTLHRKLNIQQHELHRNKEYQVNQG
jgi:hypothetical protein